MMDAQQTTMRARDVFDNAMRHFWFPRHEVIFRDYPVEVIGATSGKLFIRFKGSSSEVPVADDDLMTVTPNNAQPPRYVQYVDVNELARLRAIEKAAKAWDTMGDDVSVDEVIIICDQLSRALRDAQS